MQTEHKEFKKYTDINYKTEHKNAVVAYNLKTKNEG